MHMSILVLVWVDMMRMAAMSNGDDGIGDSVNNGDDGGNVAPGEGDLAGVYYLVETDQPFPDVCSL